MTDEQILKAADIASKEYDAIHAWLRYNHGRPATCSKCGVAGTKIKRWNIEYALKYGEAYARNIGNFLALCTSCHLKYDKLKPNTCTTPDCGGKYMAKGLCRRCYSRSYAREHLNLGKWKWSRYE